MNLDLSISNCGSDLAGCPVSRTSTTEVICQLWSASMYSRPQAAVVQSSADAELYALTSAANDLIHLQYVIIEMGIVKSAEVAKIQPQAKLWSVSLARQRSQSTLSSSIFTCKVW
eukprot:5324559-Amphidinium_carterae.1